MPVQLNRSFKLRVEILMPVCPVISVLCLRAYTKNHGERSAAEMNAGRFMHPFRKGVLGEHKSLPRSWPESERKCPAGGGAMQTAYH